MMKCFCLLSLMFVGSFSIAQNDTKTIKKSAGDSMSSNFFEDYKLEAKSKTIITSPHLDSIVAKCKKDASRIGKNNSSFFNTIKLPDNIFNSLNAKDKFVYAFNYPEQYTQICSIYFFDRYNAPFLHAELPFVTEGIVMSKRQSKSLALSRTNTISYLNEVIKASNNIGNEYKQVIVQLHAFECVPILMLKYDTSKIKDNYILTAGILLMKNDSFPAFINSSIYTQLFKGKGGWREKIDLTEYVKRHIIDLINKYYLWKQGE